MLVDEPGEAAQNMAIDGALLELAAAPTLRLYGWQPHAVSLGYFQSVADFQDLPADTAMVRRSTGGGAIHHGDELTFSLVLGATHLPGDIAASYVLLHDAIVRALAHVGVTCRRASGAAAHKARPSDRWCFKTPVDGDLITDRGKLLGSAQRRTRAGEGGDRSWVLHHGSLVLRKPSLTPFVAAVSDQVAPTTELRNGLHASLIAELAKVLGLIARPGERTHAENAMASRLRTTRFGNESHLNRR